MGIKEAYKVMQKASGIKVGDKVRCLRHFIDEELGSSCSSSKLQSQKSAFIDKGATGIVSSECSGHLWVSCGRDYGGSWAFPFFVLEVVEPAKEIEVRYFCEGKDVTDSISNETKKNLS